MSVLWRHDGLGCSGCVRLRGSREPEEPGLRWQVEPGKVTRAAARCTWPGWGRKSLERGAFEMPGRGEEMPSQDGRESGVRVMDTFGDELTLMSPDRSREGLGRRVRGRNQP